MTVSENNSNRQRLKLLVRVGPWKCILLLALIALSLTYWLAKSSALGLTISTTALDDAQYGISYNFVLRATSSDTIPTTIFHWAGGQGLPTGLSLNDAGIISGTPTGPPGTYNVTVTCTQVLNAGAATNDAAVKSFTLVLVGRLDMDSGAALSGSSGPQPADQAVDSGANGVGVWQFTLHANGEDIRLTSLTFFGLGQGSDTFDITRAKLYLDVNNNGQVDSADVFLPTEQTFVTNAGFNPSVTFNNIGFIIDSAQDNGFETFLVSYDFRSTVEAGRTFRLAMEGENNISWTTMGTNRNSASSLSGGDVNTQGRSVRTFWSSKRGNNPPVLSTALPFKSGIITIKGPTPTQATLNVSPGVFAPDSFRVSAGAVTQAAMGLRLWTDSSHTIIVNSISLDDSGSGIADSQITEVRLFYDLDDDGQFSANDLLLKSGAFFQDRVTFSNLNLLVRTPSGLPTDASAVNLLVTYTFSSNIPVLSPPLTFQPRLSPTSGIQATENVQGTPAQIVGAAIVGNVFSVVAGTLSTLTIDTGSFLPGLSSPADSGLATINVVNNDTRVVVWRGRFFADSGHAISLNALRFTPSGNLDDRFDVTSVSLVKDRDNSGTFSSGDVVVASGAYAADNDTIILTLTTPEIIRTSSGTKSDSNALNLLLMYSLNGNAPVVTPDSISFSARLLNTNDIFARVYNAGESISFTSLQVVKGRTVNVTSAPPAGSVSTGAGPTPLNATFSDNDTSGTASSGDFITVAFDTNLGLGSTATAADFVLPVLGDNLGVGAGVAFAGGNKMRITLGANPTLNIAGTYVNGQHNAGDSSGINLKDTTSGIVSIYNLRANPAGVAVDIGGALGVVVAAGPTMTTALYSDVDSSFSVNVGDQLILTFSDNISLNGAVSSAQFFLPVTGDFFGATAASVAQTAGNKLTMTFTSQPTLKITGTYVNGVHAAGSASGINLLAATSLIRDSAGRSAQPTAVAIDIGGTDTGSQNLAPVPIAAVYQDVDSSASITAGDVIDISFSSNVTLTSLPINKIQMPVLGDRIDPASVVSQIGGNKLRITLAASSVFHVSGTFSAAALTESSPSGINLLSTVSGVQDLAGRSAAPAAAAIDITAGTPGFSDSPGTTATTSSNPALAGARAPSTGPGGGKACVIERTFEANAVFAVLRSFRDLMLSSAFGRLLTGIYYSF